MTDSAFCTSFSNRWNRLVNLPRVGLGISDFLAFAALVLCAGGALVSAAALVRALVLNAGAVVGTLIGVDASRLLRFVRVLGTTGSCAVVGCTLGTCACRSCETARAAARECHWQREWRGAARAGASGCDNHEVGKLRS